MPIVPVFGGGSTPSSAPLTWAAPATVSRPLGSTTATINWPAASGGTAPYTYSTPGVAFDSQAGSTTALYSTTDLVTSVTGLANGQVIVLSRNVTDAAGATLQVQAVVTVTAGLATLTFGSEPSGQALASDATSVELGTWGAASGGIGPYTYAVTDVSGATTMLSGSGVGPWKALGLSPGRTYVYLMTATDSLGAKGYSYVTITVAASATLGEYIVQDEVDFTDADWTAISTTSTIASTTAWYATLYGADGVTPRCYLYNNNTEARTITLNPSSTGLELANGSTTVQPTIGVWPAGWSAMLGGSRRDVWMVEAV